MSPLSPPALNDLYGSAGHTGGGSGEGRSRGGSGAAAGHPAPPLSAASARRELSPSRPSGLRPAVLARGLGSLRPAGSGGRGSPLGGRAGVLPGPLRPGRQRNASSGEQWLRPELHGLIASAVLPPSGRG